MHKSPNRLLASLSSDAFAQIAPHLKVVELKFGDVLAEAGGPIRRVYFPFSSAISLVVELDVGTIIYTGRWKADDLFLTVAPGLYGKVPAE